jgi:hypothetical protein
LPAINPVTSVVIPAMMADAEEVEVVLVHAERTHMTAGRLAVECGASRPGILA